MARFSGAAGRGAARTMRAVRRAEAETRQADEQARGEERRELIRMPEHIKGTQTPRIELEEMTDAMNALAAEEASWLNDWTDAELDALRDAMLRADALEAYRQTWTRGAR